MNAGMNFAPRVGILCTQWQFQHKNETHLSQYVEAVAASGGNPVLLPCKETTAPGSTPQSVLKDIDALLIPGGGDIDPKIYNQSSHPSVTSNRQFDDFEYAFVDYAIKTKMPMLGICRGEQLMNVVGGGSLIQDIPSETNRSPEWQIEHQQRNLKTLKGDDKIPVHFIHVNPEIEGRTSVLKGLFGFNFLAVNSAHHQAVNAVAPMFSVIAQTYDGIVEAIERKDCPRQWGVQFHPERLRLVDSIWSRVFDKLVDDAKKWHEESQLDKVWSNCDLPIAQPNRYIYF